MSDGTGVEVQLQSILPNGPGGDEGTHQAWLSVNPIGHCIGTPEQVCSPAGVWLC